VPIIPFAKVFPMEYVQLKPRLDLLHQGNVYPVKNQVMWCLLVQTDAGREVHIRLITIRPTPPNLLDLVQLQHPLVTALPVGMAEHQRLHLVNVLHIGRLNSGGTILRHQFNFRWGRNLVEMLSFEMLPLRFISL